MPGGRDLVSFFRPGGRSFALKSHPQGGDFDEKKLVARGLARGRGGMVTGQIDTCISLPHLIILFFLLFFFQFGMKTERGTNPRKSFGPLLSFGIPKTIPMIAFLTF